MYFVCCPEDSGNKSEIVQICSVFSRYPGKVSNKLEIVQSAILILKYCPAIQRVSSPNISRCWAHPMGQLF